ncbi:L-xylulose reductase-like [Euwallacea fornicatus]|uniref:L-xylulose reductase-like n=1 Tax=Euwallacea fornicatus TaxID=995702 RepID=UPI00338DC75F
MDIRFENKRIMVTGAASGIGKGIAVRLVQNGATVIAVDKNQDNLNYLVSEQSSIIAAAIDLSDWTSSHDAVKQYFPVDMLVNCAGVVEVLPVTNVTEETYQKLFDVNVKGTISITQAVVTDLLSRNAQGSIVTISSQASKAGLLNHTIYSASKGALDSFTRSLALELGPKNIRVNCVNPTAVMTPLGKRAWSDSSARYAMLAKIPLQRFAEVDDVVNAVVFLLSDQASMITGHCLPVDGGFLSC